MEFKDCLKILKKYVNIEKKNQPDFVDSLFKLLSTEDEETPFDNSPETNKSYFKGVPFSKPNAEAVLPVYTFDKFIDVLNSLSDEAIDNLVKEFCENGIYTDTSEIADEETGLKTINIYKDIDKLLRCFINAAADGKGKVNITKEKGGEFVITKIIDEKTNKSKEPNKNNKKPLNPTKATDFLIPLKDNFETVELAENIENHLKIFWETTYFRKALNRIRQNRLLMIVGDPGVGKTTISEMIVLDYLKRGYKLKFSSEMGGIETISKTLSLNEEEIIYIDDCLGQAYFDLDSEQENSLIKLISFVSCHQNKVLLLNSRITITNAAKQNEKISNKLEWFKSKNLILQIGDLTDKEKAIILFRHLMNSSCITNQHCSEIKDKSNYNRVIHHCNFNPRIIEYITGSAFVTNVQESHYFDKVMDALDNPQKIWDDEFNHRLKPQDRYLLIAIYSLGDTLVDFDQCRAAYESLLRNDGNFDLTKNNWDSSLKVLNESMVRIVESNGTRRIRVINPSVNDYLEKNIMFEGSNSLLMARKSIVAYIQIERLYGYEGKNEILRDFYNSGKILSLIYFHERDKITTITEDIATLQICDARYKKFVQKYFSFADLSSKNGQWTFYYDGYTFDTIYEYLENQELFDYYIGKKFNHESIDYLPYVDEFDLYRLCELFRLISDTDYIIDIDELLKGNCLKKLLQSAIINTEQINSELGNRIESEQDFDDVYELNVELCAIAREEAEHILNEYKEFINDKLFKKTKSLIKKIELDYNDTIMDYIDEIGEEDEKADEMRENFDLDSLDIDEMFKNDLHK